MLGKKQHGYGNGGKMKKTTTLCIVVAGAHEKAILKVWLHFFRPTLVPIVQYIIYHYLIVN
jgi:hypothetical protein